MIAMVAIERCTEALLSDRNSCDGFKNQANQRLQSAVNQMSSKQNELKLKSSFSDEPTVEEQSARSEAENFKRNICL
jgi:hypothetical protein